LLQDQIKFDMQQKLFTPIKIKEITLRNRLGVSPMDQYSATDGFASDWHLVHYGTRATGGFGLVIQEASAVSPEGRITAQDLGIYKDDHVDKLRQITRFIHSQGALFAIQLAHAGRKGSCDLPWKGGKQLTATEGGWETIGPSRLSFNPDDVPPKEMTIDDIKSVEASFKLATRRALQAGYDIIEIHAAHGYLIHEFLSPLSNHRTDPYGGCFENRIRLLVEIVREIKSVWPENRPLFVRISATDWYEGGWNIDEAVQLAAVLKQEGVDLIDCSSGGLVPYQKIVLGPGYQVPFAERIRKETGIMTSGVGLITDPYQAEEILEKGQADLVLFGREALRNPYFPLQTAKALEEEIPWPLQYLRAK
jgi:2,4-dienoyl-CoA reductase-like NADH-dependent reductase (Old Yellow Enzyme family)